MTRHYAQVPLWPSNIGGPGKWADQATMGRPAPPLLEKKKKEKTALWGERRGWRGRLARLLGTRVGTTHQRRDQDCATELRDGLNKTPGTIKANHHRQGANGFCCATCVRHNRATYLWFVQRDETLSLATGLLVKLGAG